VTAAYDNSAALWDLESGERLQTFAGHGAQVTRVIPYQDGRMIATASGRGAFRLWRSDSGQLVRDLRAAPGLFNALLARDGRIFITGSALFTNSEVALWDADEGVKLTTIHVAGNLSFPNGVLLSSDERFLLTRTKSEVATVWTMPPTGQRLIDLAWERVTAAGLPLLNKEQRIRFGLDTQ
jgi:WD40 repeat protein